LAAIHATQGEYAQAEQEYKRLSDGARLAPGLEPAAASGLASAGWMRIKQGKYADAEEILREACQVLSDPAKGLTGSASRYQCDAELGVSLVAQKRYAEAEKLLPAASEALLKIPSPRPNPNIRPLLAIGADEASEWTVRMYQEWGKADQ